MALDAAKLTDPALSLLRRANEEVQRQKRWRATGWTTASAELAVQGEKGATIEMTHQQIASELGTVREVVSRILKDLKRAGEIQLSRGTIGSVTPARPDTPGRIVYWGPST